MIQTDEAIIHAADSPVWVVTINGWANPNREKAHLKMAAYKAAAEKLSVNIEFSSRLGTFGSYKYAPALASKIMEHNEQVFRFYAKAIGEDWQKRFYKEVELILDK